jgi:AcrR family transcriptional regulator
MVKRTPGRLSADVRRAQLLKAAAPVFAKLGFAASSTRQLSAAARVTEPVLYRHFRNKEALYGAVLQAAADELAVALTAAMSTVERPGARIEALATALPELLARHQTAFRLLCGAAGSATGAVLVRATRQALGGLEEAIATALGDRGLRSDVDPAMAAALLLQVGMGHALLRPVGLSTFERDDVRQRMVDMLTAALLSE